MKKVMIILIPFLLACGSFNAQDKCFDNDFGINGLWMTESLSNNFFSTDFKVQPDGKIVLLARENGQMLLFRLLEDGTEDDSFGIEGRVVLPYENLNLFSMEIEQNGDYILAGTWEDEDFTKSCLVRIKSNGTPDETFGDNGLVIHFFGMDDQTITGMVCQPDGKYVLAGFIDGPNNNVDIMTARVLPDGSRDPDFGDNGLSVFNFDNTEIVNDVILAGNGKILISGRFQNTNNEIISFLFQLNSDGSADTNFNNGNLVISNPVKNLMSPLSLLPDETILLANVVSVGAETFTIEVSKFNAVGNLVTTFQSGTLSVSPDLPFFFWMDMEVNSEGDFFVSTFSFDSATSLDTYTVAFNSDGSFNTGFFENGTARCDFGEEELAARLEFDSNGDLLIMGLSGPDLIGDNPPYTIFVGRYKLDKINATAENPAFATEIKIYPNPFRRETTIALTTKESTTVLFEINNINGQSVYQIPKLDLLEGRNEIRLSNSEINLLNGIYYYSIRNSDGLLKIGKLIVGK